MTNEQMRAVQDDLAYMRALAEEGRRAPLLGGSVLVAGGLIYGVAAIVHWAIAADVLVVHPLAYSVVWTAALAVFFAIVWRLKARMAHQPGAHAANNRAYSIAWMGLGSACGGIAMAIILGAVRLQDPVLFGMFPPMILSLYGGGWLIAEALSDRKWLRWVGIASLVAAVGSVWLIGTPEQWLAYGVALVLLAAVPGYMLARQEPAEIV